MSAIFDLPIWAEIQPYARLSAGRDNLDLLQLPDALRDKAKAVVLPCCACAAPISVFRARLKSGRSRIKGLVEEHRLFYAATCPSGVNPGCARSRQAKEAKAEMRRRLGAQREPAPAISVEILDASGMVIYRMASEVHEQFEVALPKGAASIVFVPRSGS